jgi:uncharacterized protein (DUF2147 family)
MPNFNLSFYRGSFAEFKEFAASVCLKRGATTTFGLWKHKKDKRLFVWTINRTEDAVWTGTVATLGFEHRKTFSMTVSEASVAAMQSRNSERLYRGYHGQDSGH